MTDESSNQLSMKARAIIVKISNACRDASVRRFELRADRTFQFRAGQWIDAFVPPQIGGFSFLSMPSRAAEDGTFELAVQKTHNPPAIWMHEVASEGTQFDFQVGGDWFLDTDEAIEQPKNLLLIAGGVGLVPIHSICLTALHESSRFRVHLLYSTKSTETSLFDQDFELLRHNDRFSFKRFLTSENAEIDGENDVNRRISENDLKKAVDLFDNDDITAFLCGPPLFADSMATSLQQFDNVNVRYEKWW